MPDSFPFLTVADFRRQDAGGVALPNEKTKTVQSRFRSIYMTSAMRYARACIKGTRYVVEATTTARTALMLPALNLGRSLGSVPNFPQAEQNREDDSNDDTSKVKEEVCTSTIVLLNIYNNKLGK
jgi:hypothetical protein